MNQQVQQTIFKGEIFGDILVHGNKNEVRKNDKHRTVVLDPQDDKWVVDIANAISTETGNAKYGASTVIREAIHFYREFYSHRRKLLHKKKTVLAILETT